MGLGHLGQAYGWVLSWLNYADPTQVQVVLQDTDKTAIANRSTGVLTPAASHDLMKTRLVAAALDSIGYDTRIVERSLDDNLKISAADVHVALIGVDNLPARRAISNVGWKLAIDTGLGAGATDFCSILLRRFPSNTSSTQVVGWTDPVVGGALYPIHQRSPTSASAWTGAGWSCSQAKQSEHRSSASWPLRLLWPKRCESFMADAAQMSRT